MRNIFLLRAKDTAKVRKFLPLVQIISGQQFIVKQ
jgi:hypothetical protein